MFTDHANAQSLAIQRDRRLDLRLHRLTGHVGRGLVLRVLEHAHVRGESARGELLGRLLGLLRGDLGELDRATPRDRAHAVLRDLARAPDISALHLRPARVEDLAWVLSLRNLPESVAVSNRCRPLSIDELPDPFAEFARVWVAQRGDQRVGYVTATLEQVDDAPRRSLIGLVIAPESRGQGLAAQCIEAACRHLDAMGWGPVDAFVFAGNLASEAAFARAGFVPMMSALQPDGRTRRTWRREPEVASSDAP
jgi:GNAT superfamily N-acetyltransferase